MKNLLTYINKEKMIYNSIFLGIIITMFISLFGFSDEEIRQKFHEQGFNDNEQEFFVGLNKFYDADFEASKEKFLEVLTLDLHYSYVEECSLYLAQSYMLLGILDSALTYASNSFGSVDNPVAKSIELLIKHELGFDIESQKKILLKEWEIADQFHAYFVCSFLIQVQDYRTALDYLRIYEQKLVEYEIRTSNIQYIFYAHSLYELQDYNNALTNIEKALAIDQSDISTSYCNYWKAIILYKLGKKSESSEAFRLARSNEIEYSDLFVLLSFWEFSDENKIILESISRYDNE